MRSTLVVLLANIFIIPEMPIALVGISCTCPLTFSRACSRSAMFKQAYMAFAYTQPCVRSIAHTGRRCRSQAWLQV